VLFGRQGPLVVSGMGNRDYWTGKFRRLSSAPHAIVFFASRQKRCHWKDWVMLARGDALLAVSLRGETEEIVRLLEALKRLEISLLR